MTKIIGVVQVKGGAGRSTVATNLAGELSKIGRTVLIDGDLPQGTAASWYAIREQAGKAGGTDNNLVIDTAADHRELIVKIEKHTNTADYIVLDGPPRIAEMTKAVLILADLCLIPVGASAAEIWATTDILSLIEKAKKVKPITARMLWTRHRSFTKLAQELTEAAAEQLGLPALKTTLGMRVAYMEALGAGLTVAEMADPIARLEASSLTAEVKTLMRKL